MEPRDRSPRNVPARLLFVMLVLGDFALTVLHLAWVASVGRPDRVWLITRDYSFGEMFQHTKEGWTVVLLGVLAVRTGNARVTLWIAVFAYVLIDDALRVHELAGRTLAEKLSLPDALGLAGVNFGEMLWLAAVGTVVVASACLFYRRGDAEFQSLSRGYFVLLAGFAFFGGVADAAHAMTDSDVIGVIEESGELIMLSAAAAYTFGRTVEAFATPTRTRHGTDRNLSSRPN